MRLRLGPRPLSQFIAQAAVAFAASNIGVAAVEFRATIFAATRSSVPSALFGPDGAFSEKINCVACDSVKDWLSGRAQGYGQPLGVDGRRLPWTWVRFAKYVCRLVF